MTNNYRRWELDELVQRFALKKRDEFFRTEVHFLGKIAPEIKTLLDVGCASGRLIELLKEYNNAITYSGIDISKKNINSARHLYSEATFWLGNAIDFEPRCRYDLVNATGVVQHEAKYTELIDAIFRLSRRFVLFDAKVSALGVGCDDPAISYAGTGEFRAPYNIFRLGWLVDHLMANFKVKRLEIVGYPTPINSVTVVPDWIGAIYSVGVLCEKSVGSASLCPEIQIEVA